MKRSAMDYVFYNENSILIGALKNQKNATTCNYSRSFFFLDNSLNFMTLHILVTTFVRIVNFVDIAAKLIFLQFF